MPICHWPPAGTGNIGLFHFLVQSIEDPPANISGNKSGPSRCHNKEAEMFTNNQPANSREGSVSSDHSEHEPIQNNDDDTIIPEIGDMNPDMYPSLLPDP